MSEEASAFARHDEGGDPFPIVAEDAAATEAAIAPQSEAAVEATTDDARRETDDPDVVASLSRDGRQFLVALISRLADKAQHAAGDRAALGIALSRLGQGLADDANQQVLFQSLVDALDRRRPGPTALREVVPVIAAFLARSVGAQALQDASESNPGEATALFGAAEDVVAAALEAGCSRAWRRLPDIAATVASRAADRAVPLGALAEALPRLAARFGSWPRDTADYTGIVSITDHPRGDPPRGGAADEPRRMVISGPVEIVILDR